MSSDTTSLAGGPTLEDPADRPGPDGRPASPGPAADLPGAADPRDATSVSAAGPSPSPRRYPGCLSWPRNIWRQLTSMRTALILLFLLALASLPGALLPQWSLNRGKTAQFIIDHGAWGTLLNRLGFFAVFASPWYAAIYLLLFTSLVGCLLPRTADFVRALRQPPVATPRNLARLPLHQQVELPGDPDAVADRVTAGLRGWRRVRRAESAGGVSVSAERGYLREVGNLVFHLSLLGLLVAVAVGKTFGYEGSVIVTTGLGPASGFCSQAGNYDNFRPGLAVDGTDLTPFCVQVDSFVAQYTDAGQASSFRAEIRSQTGPDLGTRTWAPSVLEVNDPLRIAGQRLYLLGHGYSPTFTVSYPDGTKQTQTAPFQPQDSAFTSQGAVKFLDPPGYTGAALRSHQLAVVGIFAPTALLRGGIMTSSFPRADDPGVAVDIYTGDLGMETGRAQSVFAIDMGQVDRGVLTKQARTNLTVGQSVTLPDGTSVAFTGVHEWVSLQTSYDPAQGWALVFAVLLLGGLMLSLIIKRRRVWFRITPLPTDPQDREIAAATTGPPGAVSGSTRTVAGGSGRIGKPSPVSSLPRVRVDMGGLARTDQAGYGEEFDRLVALAQPEQDAGSHGPASVPRRRNRGWR